MNPEAWLRRIVNNIIISFIIGAFGGVIAAMSRASYWAGVIAAVSLIAFGILEFLHWAELIEVRG